MSERARLSRRGFLAGSVATVGAWSAPSIIGVERAVAAGGSCTPQTITWTGGSASGGQYTITGSNGGLAIRAFIRPNLSSGGVPQIYLSSGRIVIAMYDHQIGDHWDVDLQFTSSSGTICSAGLTVLDIDQNGRNLGCATVSRFRDELTNLTGAGLTTTPQGGLAEVSPGVWASTLLCKTTNTENLALDWTSSAGVTGGGFRWRAGTPPGSSQTLDRQLIIITPVTLCVSGLPLAANELPSSVPRLQPEAIVGLPSPRDPSATTAEED